MAALSALFLIAGCGGGGGGGAADPNAPVSIQALTARPYRLYSLVLNPGTNGANVGLDSAFLSVEESVVVTETATLRDLTLADASTTSATTDLRFNRASGTFRSRLTLDAAGRAAISEGRSAAGLFETFGSAGDDRLGIYFPNVADRTLALETEIEFRTRAAFSGRATLDIDRASISEGDAEVLAFPLRLRSVAITDPPRPEGEVLVRRLPSATTGGADVLEPLSLHGFGVALRESDGSRPFSAASLGGAGGAARRYTAVLFEAGRADVTDDTLAAGPVPATRTVTTLRAPLQALGVGDLAIDGAGQVVFGSLSPALDSALGLGVDRVVLAVDGRVFPLEGLVESPTGSNRTGLFGGEIRTSDGGPLGTTIRIVEMKLSDGGDLAVGVGTARLSARSFVRNADGSTTERTSTAELALLVMLLAQDGAAPPATSIAGNEYHYLGVQPFDAVSAQGMAFLVPPSGPNEVRSIAIQNGGPTASLDAALGPRGGGTTAGLSQFLVGIVGIGQEAANRYRWSGRIEGRSVSQIGAWEQPGRGDLLVGSSFQFGSLPDAQAGADTITGRLGDFAVLGRGGRLGFGVADFDNPNGPRLFFLSRRRVIDAPTVQVLLDLFR